MSTDVLLPFTLASVALVLLPGPNLLYIVTRGMTQGRRAAVASAVGVEAGNLFQVVAAGLGLSALVASSAAAFTVVKWVGAGYLILLGVRAWMGREEPLETAPGEGAPTTSWWRLFRRGVLISALNPKVALFFLAFLPQFVRPARGSVVVQTLLLGAIFVAVATLLDLVYAVASGAVGRWLARHRAVLQNQHLIAGAVYVGLGVTVALGGSSAES